LTKTKTKETTPQVKLQPTIARPIQIQKNYPLFLR